MAQYTVGDFIKENRIQRGITQEALSEGICTPATLSKIENGAQTPSRGIYEALMQRLGKDDSLFSSYSSKKEMEKQELMFRIGRKMTHKDYDGIEEDYQKLEECIEEKDRLAQQFLFYSRTIVNRRTGKEENIDITIRQLIEALHMTQPNFDVENPARSHFLTCDEIMILNNIAVLSQADGNMTRALRIQFYLKEYMEHNMVDIKEKGGHYTLILSNLATWLRQVGRVEEGLEMVNLAIDASIQYGKLALFPSLLLNKGVILDLLQRKQEAIETYRQVYYISRAVKDEARAKRTMELLAKYGILIE
ncbi:MAG: helix-turn-helix domain-containing protein [Lachnospiraceae bacterium]|nr:helix-turn-helix domain-containing protein [Lachnospiraceae bacterium]